MKKSIKKFVSMMLAVACVMSLSISAFAAETTETTTVTANVYVAGGDNTVLEGTTAYFTPSGWTANIRPITPSTDNAEKTVDSTGTTLSIEMNNTVFRLVSLPGGEDSYTDAEGWTATIYDSDEDGYADSIEYFFPAGVELEAGTQYRIDKCTCYALPAAIVGDNNGIKTMAVSMMYGQTPS